MVETNPSGAGARTPVPLAQSVLQALDNERQLDLHFRRAHAELAQDWSVPNFKVMKQLALRKRLGRLYRPLIALAPWAVTLLAIAQWPVALGRALFAVTRPDGPALYIVATTPANVALIDAALVQADGGAPTGRERHVLTRRMVGQSAGVAGLLACVADHVRILVTILRGDAARRADLLLHARDALDLLLLARFAASHPSGRFATDDHYQRWAFLLSHHARDLHVVQHGFLATDIVFLHAFGGATVVHLRDRAFQDAFARYYRVGSYTVFSPPVVLDRVPLPEKAIFLASSFPAIDAEIRLLTLLKAKTPLPVVVKFHPAHVYDNRRQDLAALADHVCADADMPDCRLFVSYNSFMEFDYKGTGIPAFSIARAGGPEATAQAILALLQAQAATRATTA